MTKIRNTNIYKFDVSISDNDYVIGSDAETIGKITKNYKIGNLREYINAGLAPEVGGTLKITEVKYEGVLTTPSDVVNALDPDYEVLAYHVVFVKVNGQQFLLKLQNRFIGLTQEPVVSENFIEFPVSVGPQGIQGIQGEVGNGIESIELTNTVGLVKTYTITFTDSTTFNFNISDGEQGIQGEIGLQGPAGADGVSVLNNGISTQVTGIGTELDPYIVNVINLQKEITTSYTLQASDHLHTIFLSPTTEMIITIPETGLPNNFAVGFYHVSRPGEYAIFFEVENALTQELRVPSGFIATMNTNGNFSCMIERRLATQEYMLNGDLVAL